MHKLVFALLLIGCADPKDDDDKLFEGEQVVLVPRVDWGGHPIPDGGWQDAALVVIEVDAATGSTISE
jgi:hypothetical protein